MRATSLAIAVSLILPLNAGCEDTQARRRGEVQAEISTAARKLNEALVISVDPQDPNVDSIRQSLQDVARSAGGINDGSDGQQAAAALIASSANLELGQLTMNEASQLQAQASEQRSAARRRIAAAFRLDAIVQTRSSLGSDEQRSLLSEDREQSQAMLDDYRTRLGELSGPITEREMENARDGSEAARLETEANAHYRQASEQGHADGLEVYEEAVRLEREADRHQLARARREIDLRYDLGPEQDLAQGNVSFYESLLSTIDATETSLDELDRTGAEQVDETRQRIDALDEEIAAALQELSATGDTLAALWEDADARLSEAADQARRSASRGDRATSGAARVAAARVLEMQGRMQWNRARSLNEHAAMLQTLSNASFLDAASQTGGDVRAVAEQRDQALEAARTAFDAALSELAQAGGSGQELAAFRQSLEKNVAALAGEPVQASGTAAAEPAEADDTGAGLQRRGRPQPTGAESPEALAAIVGSANNLKGFAAVTDVLVPLDTLSGAERALVRASMDVLDAVVALDTAMNARFGSGLEQMPGFTEGMLAGAGSLPVSATASVSGSSGTVEIEMSDGTTQSSPIERIGDRWFLSASHLMRDLPPGTDLSVAATMNAKLAALFRRFAREVEAGQHESAEALAQVMGTAIATEMMGNMELPDGAEAPE